MTAGGARARHGVTLVELLIAMAILGIIVTAIIAIWLGSNRTFQSGMSIAEAQPNARWPMTRLEREIRSGGRRRALGRDARVGDARGRCDRGLPHLELLLSVRDLEAQLRTRVAFRNP